VQGVAVREKAIARAEIIIEGELLPACAIDKTSISTVPCDAGVSGLLRRGKPLFARHQSESRHPSSQTNFDCTVPWALKDRFERAPFMEVDPRPWAPDLFDTTHD